MRGPLARAEPGRERLVIFGVHAVTTGQDESHRTDRDAQMARFTRPEQTFPTLTPAEIERLRNFGELRIYKDGELLFETGKPGPGMFVVLKGHVAITQR